MTLSAAAHRRLVLRSPPGDPPYWATPCYSLCICLSTVLFVLWIPARRAQKEHRWGLGDRWSFSIIFYSLGLQMFSKGGGRHAWELTPEEAEAVIYWFNLGTIAYAITMCFIKTALLLLYCQMFLVPKQYIRTFRDIRELRRNGSFSRAILVFMAILWLFYFSTTMVKILECVPRSKIWIPEQPGTCIDTSILLDASGAFNVLTDGLLILIALWKLWGLRIHKIAKIKVMSVFSVGLLALIFSILGFRTRFDVTDSDDPTYTESVVHLWASAEITCANICACLCAFRHHIRSCQSLVRRLQSRPPAMNQIHEDGPVAKRRLDEYNAVADLEGGECVLRFPEQIYSMRAHPKRAHHVEYVDLAQSDDLGHKRAVKPESQPAG